MSTIYCSCERPISDADHDAGCRRCGNPIHFDPASPDAAAVALAAGERIYAEYRDDLQAITSARLHALLPRLLAIAHLEGQLSGGQQAVDVLRGELFGKGGGHVA